MPLDGQVSDYLAPDTETKPDVFSLRSLVAWLETQPSETEYHYLPIDGCLIDQWCNAVGIKMPGPVLLLGLPTTNAQKIEYVAMETPHTFGAALSRARALLASRNR